MEGRSTVDQQWIKTVFPTTYPMFFFSQSVFLDQSEFFWKRVMIPQQWRYKDDLSIACRVCHHAYQTQCVVTPQHTTTWPQPTLASQLPNPIYRPAMHSRLPGIELSYNIFISESFHNQQKKFDFVCLFSKLFNICGRSTVDPSPVSLSQFIQIL